MFEFDLRSAIRPAIDLVDRCLAKTAIYVSLCLFLVPESELASRTPCARACCIKSCR